MGRKSAGGAGWIVLAFIGFAFAKCGDTKTSAPAPASPPATALYSPAPGLNPLPAAAPAPSLPAVPTSTPAPSPSPAPTTTRYLTTPEVALRPVKRSLYVTGKEVPIREAPSGKAKILDRLPTGMEVGELGRREGWVEVRHPVSAVEGWMSTRRLTTKRPADDEDDKPTKVEPPSPIVNTEAIIAALIARSLASYPGNCACPYNTDRAGRSCGRRSAHSKGGGRAPLCYPDDITPAMIANYKGRGGR